MIAQPPLALVADTGGTNTRMALARAGILIAGTTTRFRNADYPGLTSIIADYLSQHRSQPDCAAFALAGLVEDGSAEMTNLGWRVDADQIARASHIRQVHLLNDLQAQGHALNALSQAHLRTIVPGRPSGQTRLVIGLGTGVNAAPVYPVAQGGFVVPPSEAGHMHLPLRGDLDHQLAAWLIARRGVASVEDVLSGVGLERLYTFHAEQAGHHGGADAATIMAQMEAGAPLAQTVGRHYVRLLAQATASLALISLPYAGIYLIGGVARAFAQWLAPFGFAQEFHDMGRMSGIMQRFPVALIEDDYTALQGCASYLAQLQPH